MSVSESALSRVASTSIAAGVALLSPAATTALFIAAGAGRPAAREEFRARFSALSVESAATLPAVKGGQCTAFLGASMTAASRAALAIAVEETGRAVEESAVTIFQPRLGSIFRSYFRQSLKSMVRILTGAMLANGYRIEQSGTYTLADGGALYSSVAGLTVAVSNVRLELAGNALEGTATTEILLEIEAGLSNVTIKGPGRITGGVRGVHIARGCSYVEIDGVCSVEAFTFAGIVIEAGDHITLSDVCIGSAAAAPLATVFGVIALPAGGFCAADKLLRGATVAARPARGGTALTLHRVTVQDISPHSDKELARLGARLREDAYPSVVDVGHRVNASGPRAMSRTATVPAAWPRRHSVEGAGAHGVAIFNWQSTTGVDSARVACPSPLNTFEAPLAHWGDCSAVLALNTLRDTQHVGSPDVPTQTSVSSNHGQVTYSRNVFMGATGNHVTAHCNV